MKQNSSTEKLMTNSLSNDLAPNSERVRENLISELRSQLLGPRNGEGEWLPKKDPPNKRYLSGILYPRDTSEDLDEDSSGVITDGDAIDDSPLSAMLQRAPASAGMTFALESDSVIKIKIRASEYLEEELPNAQGKKPIPKGFRHSPLNHEEFELSDESQHDYRKLLWQGRAEFRLRWRKLNSIRVVTISIVNLRKSEEGLIKSSDCLYQVGMSVSCSRGGFAEPPYPNTAFDAEEAELRLRYRNFIGWSTGHSASTTWQLDEQTQRPKQIDLEFMPSAEVKPFTPGVRENFKFDKHILNLEWLSKCTDVAKLRSGLIKFIEDFSIWMHEQRKIVVGAPHLKAAQQILEGLEMQEDRLRHGINILCDIKYPERFNSFILANQAMLDQMQASALKNREHFISAKPEWRPFQLAFQLLSIPGVISDEPKSGRQIVDLIWFPTGGGKTEAYLLLAAFIIIFRRFKNGDSGCGTAVISRYTLRLLTNQQFERTAALACALECMRRTNKIPGKHPIDVGLWIGGGNDSAPNTYKTAMELAERTLQEQQPINRFLLLKCPWCGTNLLPKNQTDDRRKYGFEASATEFRLRCPSTKCVFVDRLPVQVVDEGLYEQPPAILLGTIDKFARLPWEQRARSFFGFSSSLNPLKFKPPDLVIQDELHLISGPLGTIAAIYEAGMDVLSVSAGGSPKYIAATATIRGAADQAWRLYARSVFIFPAPGIGAEDSYYMSIGGEGVLSRKYIGVMGLGHTPVTSSVHCMAAMLDGAQRVSDGDEYWTLVAYHNSRRELGKTMTLARDDVPGRIKVITTDSLDTRKCENIVELSANIPNYRIPEVILEAGYLRNSGNAIDVLACTSMISVGVDIPRLNYIVVIGQPKTTSEYIQATSRVGRKRGAAGIVVTNCVATKPRDRAHFENFRRYHESIYRWVEPSSITPDSPQALDRALHAVIIMVVRLCYLNGPEDAKKFTTQDLRINELLEHLRVRLRAVIQGPSEIILNEKFNKLVEWWSTAASKPEGLSYKAEVQFRGLMKFYGSQLQEPARETLNSMRNVDGQAVCGIMGAL
jgi:Helicase conserved C-terminal domain